MARVIDDVTQAEHAGVRHREEPGRHLRAGDEISLEACALGHGSEQRREATRHHGHLLAQQERAELEPLGMCGVDESFGHP
jgi:hypothetical protein